ncbi:MAG: SAF domain-containing protein [Atopobiaceae bacterium]|nr:SAF domain-containing protein [Atopobiaceae bacterium]
MSSRIRIMAAAACAVGAMAASMAYAQQVKAAAVSERDAALERYGGEVTSLVVARRQLEAGDVVTKDDVETREWLADLAPEGCLSAVDEVVGKTVTEPVAKGSPVGTLAFRDPAGAVSVPSGHVAVTIPVTDKLGVSRDIAVGAAVQAWSVGDAGARLLSSDMTVLAVPAAKATQAGSLTLAVVANDVQAVLVSSAAGELRLVMPASDVSAPATGQVAAAAPSSVAAQGTGESR